MYSKKGFTLVEILIVVSIIGILAAALFPFAHSYISRARDVRRVSDIRSLAGVFQVYRNVNEALPDNSSGSANYCVSTILTWTNGVGKDRQYEELAKNFTVTPKETTLTAPAGPCTQSGSYIYSRLIDATSIQYGVLAAKLETDNNITYLTGADFTNNTNILAIMQAQKIYNVNVNALSGGQAPLYHMIVY